MQRQDVRGLASTNYGKTRKEVDDKLTKAKHDNAQGIFVAPHKLTLGGWLDTWLAEYKKPRLRPITFDTYEMIVRRHIKPSLGHITMRTLRLENLQRYYNDKMQQDLTAQTIRLHHVILSNALSQAEKNGLIVRNVCRLAVLPRQEHREMETLTVNQVRTQLLPTIKDDRLFAVYYLAFATGLRRGELLALQWRNVNLKEGVLHVRQTLIRVSDAEGNRKTKLIFSEPKTPQSRRTVPIPKECISALRRHRA